jgi:hypothetical protein
MRAAILPLFLAVVAAGCGSSERTAAEPVEPSPQPPPPPAIAQPEPPPSIIAPAAPVEREPPGCVGNVHGLGGDRLAYAAVAERETVAYDEPGGSEIGTFGLRNENGHLMVFGVRRVVLGKDCKIDWYRVRLPMRPNGSEGYVHADDVRLVRVPTRIFVDLSERKLSLYKQGEAVLTATVAIGAPGTPTPTGRYYVNQRLIASDPTGPWGPAAVGISAFSDVLQEWIQGGPIAIHGTNDPSSIGQAVSHGCIRLPNDVLRQVFDTADAGTPVIITA